MGGVASASEDGVDVHAQAVDLRLLLEGLDGVVGEPFAQTRLDVLEGGLERGDARVLGSVARHESTYAVTSRPASLAARSTGSRWTAGMCSAGLRPERAERET